ncbi:MAG: enolase C-terminal domain-like protein [Bryobacteraceae bacterium]|nr:enolase C-terminal domain-like protein [Bryobacteraceae bacterium]
MNRRNLIQTLAGAAASVPLPMAAQQAAAKAPGSIRITDVKTYVTNPQKATNANYVVVKIETNQQGLVGWGDATCTGSELGVSAFLEEHLKPGLIGQNPMELERLWQRVFFLPYYRSGSVHMSAVSGIDMALWDIKGKVAGLPVYELLGGKVRDKLLTYKSVGGRDNKQVEESAKRLMADGYKVIKVQVALPGNEAGYAVPATGAQQELTKKAYDAGMPPDEVFDPSAYLRTLPKLFEHLRKTCGEEIEFLHDVHERITPSQALQLAKAVEQYRLFYFEDPLRPEHLDTFRLIRQQCSTPIAMGEIYTGQWDGLFLITEHLIDYVRHDLAHCGGVTTGKKIATMCEPYGILTAWHGPSNISPLTHATNCAVSLSVPNFGIQEYGGFAKPVFEVFSDAPKYDKGYVTVNDKPGLGVEVNEAAAKKYPYVRRLRPAIRQPDGTPWPY